MLSRSYTTLICLAVAAACSFIALPDATACSPAPSSALAATPLNGERVVPGTEVMVIGEGLVPTNGGDVTFTNRSGGDVAYGVEVLMRPGFVKWMALYQPESPLEPTAYDFFVNYPNNPQGGTSTSFQVEQGEAPAPPSQPTIAQWDTITFVPGVQGDCESYDSLTLLTIDIPSREAPARWYEVELASAGDAETVKYGVVPGFGAQPDDTNITREIQANFAVECVRVTPVDSTGARGPTAETCEPASCPILKPEETDFATLWDDLPACDRETTDPSGGSAGGSDEGCSAAPSDAAPGSALLLLGCAALLATRRRSQ